VFPFHNKTIKEQPLLRNPKPQTQIIGHQYLNHQKHFLFNENHVKDETLTKQNEIVNHNEDQNPKPE